MCGISGIFSKQINDQHKKMVADILKDQFTRGPDHQATSTISTHQSDILLGHNRLSIIDLSAEANQPMWDTSGRYCICYNGEIYNYIELRTELKNLNFSFHTKSDTEVILNAFAAWGIDALNRFHGPFSFALVDSHTGELWLCRDRFGVRPLFYFIQNETLHFASSTRILAKTFNLPPNLSYVVKGLKYLVYEDDTDISPYQNLLALPASSYLYARFKDGKLQTTIHTYYHLMEHVAKLSDMLASYQPPQLLSAIHDQFEQAVQVRLRTDVPLAISLSSGLDSSSVASFVRKEHEHTIGFSFAHPSQKNTEGPLVAKCAKFLDIHIEYVWPTHQEMIDGLFKTIEAQDAPFSSLSVVAQYLLYQRVRACGVKVLLGGQGGDESFMGYRKFLFFWLRQLLNQRRYLATAKNLLHMLPSFAAELKSLGAYWRHRHRYLNNQPVISALELPFPPQLNLNQPHQSLQKRQAQDITQFSLPTLLRYEDRNGMAHSVESRLPFLDHRLVELGLALPEAIKIKKGYGKWAIREIMHDKIPDQIRLARYKRGFDIPMRELLNVGLGKSIRIALHEKPQTIKAFLKKGMHIDHIFSDQQFLRKPSTMAEAITLLWLNKVVT